jgi:hypothetical protein
VWEEIAKLVYILREETARNIGFRIFASQGRETQVPYVASLVFKQREWKETRGLEIARLPRLSMAYEAMDPRDKVYALFGLMGEDDKNFIEPDLPNRCR